MSNKVEGSLDSLQKSAAGDEKTSTVKKTELEKNKDQNIAAVQGGGWFGGIFNKLSMKPKNQMILPDDKNPTVNIDNRLRFSLNRNCHFVDRLG